MSGLGALLHRGDIPIMWTSDGREYNPDLVVIEEMTGTHLLVGGDQDEPGDDICEGH